MRRFGNFLRYALAGALILAVFVASRPGLASPADEGKSSVLAQPPAAPAGSSPCGRECLYDFTDKFFEALGMHNPYGVAMAPGIKYTENGHLVKPGEGMWKTFSRRGTYRVYLADPANGTVGFYGNYSEFDGTLLGVMAVRIRVKEPPHIRS